MSTNPWGLRLSLMTIFVSEGCWTASFTLNHIEVQFEDVLTVTSGVAPAHGANQVMVDHARVDGTSCRATTFDDIHMDYSWPTSGRLLGALPFSISERHVDFISDSLVCLLQSDIRYM